MKTFYPTNETALSNRKWHVIDAEGQVVGRLATKIASILRGKHNPAYTPHNDSGDFVVVVNAEKVKFTGKKTTDKSYFRHTGYVGGIRELSAQQILDSHPERIIQKAVKGMLPSTVLGRRQLSKLKIYSGSEHPHAAQVSNV